MPIGKSRWNIQVERNWWENLGEKRWSGRYLSINLNRTVIRLTKVASSKRNLITPNVAYLRSLWFFSWISNCIKSNICEEYNRCSSQYFFKTIWGKRSPIWNVDLKSTSEDDNKNDDNLQENWHKVSTRDSTTYILCKTMLDLKKKRRTASTERIPLLQSWMSLQQRILQHPDKEL